MLKGIRIKEIFFEIDYLNPTETDGYKFISLKGGSCIGIHGKYCRSNEMYAHYIIKSGSPGESLSKSQVKFLIGQD